MLLSVIAAARIAAAQDPATTPKITSISKITTAEHQTITITGTGFGTHKAYTGNSNMRGEEVLGTGKLKGGVARFTTSALEFGENSIRAVYGGDSDFERTSRDDESASLKHTVE